MIQQNDYKTPRDRISDDFLEKLLAEDETDMRGVCAIRHDVVRTEQRVGCKNDKGSYTRGNTYPSLAMVYSPFQEFENLYEPEEALSKGTLFADLYLPFESYCCGGNTACAGKCGVGGVRR